MRGLLLLLAGCQIPFLTNKDVDEEECEYVAPPLEEWSMASDPDCTGIAVLPDAGRDVDYQPDERVWIADLRGTTEIECVFTPHPDSCQNSESWSIHLGADTSAVATGYDCLCADVMCVDLFTDEALRSWTWNLGSCAS